LAVWVGRYPVVCIRGRSGLFAVAATADHKASVDDALRTRTYVDQTVPESPTNSISAFVLIPLAGIRTAFTTTYGA
jgi:hypothetical protein